MYNIYWTTYLGQLRIAVPEADVQKYIGALTKLNFEIDKVEMS